MFSLLISVNALESVFSFNLDLLLILISEIGFSNATIDSISIFIFFISFVISIILHFSNVTSIFFENCKYSSKFRLLNSKIFSFKLVTSNFPNPRFCLKPILYNPLFIFELISKISFLISLISISLIKVYSIKKEKEAPFSIVL